MNIDYDLIINYIWENVTFELFLKFVLVYFFIIWVALIVWVIKDISNRTQSLILQLFAVLIIVLLSPLWIVIYLIIRPWKTLLEKYYEEIDQNLDTVEEVIEDKNCKEEESIHCPKCDYPISHDFSFCPNCNLKSFSFTIFESSSILGGLCIFSSKIFFALFKAFISYCENFIPLKSLSDLLCEKVLRQW